MVNARLSFLFYRYVRNQCSESERLEFLRLIEDPENDAQLKLLMGRAWEQTGERKLSEERSDRILREILLTRERSNVPWFRMAAIFIMVALSVLGLFYYRAAHLKPSFAQHVSEKTKSNFIELPDGSTVILNAGGKLNYPEALAGPEREVYLEGEGFFDIKPDSLRPFVVHTGSLRTTVLGTAFNIQAYPDKELVVVTVKRGKVEVSDDKQTFGILNPNQQISLNRHHDIAEQTTVDPEQVIAWIERDISFDNVTMNDAINQLEKRFDVSIGIESNSGDKCRFTATFVRGEDLRQILQVLCEFNNATLVERENGFTVRGGNCQ